MSESNKTYNIITMGCQMNERDSETIAGMLEEAGYIVQSENGSPADIIVINTCSVRENANNKFFGLLGGLKKLKRTNPETLIVVCGCMMQEQHVIDSIKSKFSWVDIVFGTHNIDEFPGLLRSAAAEHLKLIEIKQGDRSIVENLPQTRKYPYKAFVNITYGCNNFCTYCIVPYVRGRLRSRRPSDVLDEVQALCKDGVREITLLGQNVNSYAGRDELGTDLADSNDVVDFTALLCKVADTPGLARLRFMTSQPKNMSDSLIDAFGDIPNLCPAIHLPVQAGGDEILKRMHRRYTREDYFTLVDKLRDVRPDIVISTDLIVGFPGETEADFEDTMSLIERVRFDSAFTFLYSPRIGTPAATYENQIPEEIKHKRFERMVERLNEITVEKNTELIGQTFEILTEGASKSDDEMLSGRTPGGKLVHFPCPDGSKIAPGDFVSVKITAVKTFSLFGVTC